MKLRSKNDKTKLSKQQHNALWNGVTEKDFNNEVNVEDAEIGEFDKKHMLLFAANTNLFRQIVRLSDSLKPVERRILYSLYKLNCRPGTKTKSAIIVSNTMKFHCHGDCLAADTKFMLASGEIKTIKELYDSQQPVEVLSLDTNRKVRIATAHHFRIGQYTKRLYHIQLSNGQEIVCTNNHPIMVYTSRTTIDYIKAENLVVGDELYSGTTNPTKLNQLIGSVLEHTSNTHCTPHVSIQNIVVEESPVDVPMYDFTVDNLQNALIVTVTNQDSDSTCSLACVHNSPIYSSFVNLAQPWKRAVPLVSGKGNFGNASNPDLYAHYRYTEGCMSKYAWECFFDDYDEDCVETLFNSSSDSEEPMALPSKFPNILVNGGMGIAFGNSFRIPPYNINDIIDKCKAVLFNPNTVDLFMVPDFPCDCDIIDDGESLQSIIDTGEGSIKMRGRVEIAPYGQHWMLSITSVPWMCNLQSILDRVRTLAKAGEFSIIDIQPADYSVKMPDGSIQTKLDTRIIINKAHDPYVIRDKLYSTTDLEKTVSINFKVVTENLTIEKMNMRDLINSWIDERRSYKRRLYNKRLTKISARIELLSVLIYLLQKDNIEKTVKVIKNSNSSDLENQLMKLCSMSSYQAHKISEMRLSAFTKDARKRYEEERAKLEKEREEVLGIIRSEKKIDKIIASELDDLRKYATPRKTNIIQPSTEKIVSDTTHNVIVTKNGYIKKLHYNNSYSVNMGAFKAGDYPISRTIAHNMDSLIFFDSFGRYSIIPVHDIANNEPSQYGHQLFNTTKLSGTVVGVELYMNDNMIDELNKIGTPYLVTATARGYIKKTPLATYLEMRNTKNVKCMKVRDDDSLVYAGIILENTSILIYTKLGSYVLLDVNSITEQGKDNMGLMSIKMDPEDSLCGVTIIGKEDTDIVILTEKGNMKKCPIGLFGDVTKRTTIGNQYHMATLEVADKINCALGIKKDSGVIICTRTDVFKYDGSEIPEMTKKAKGKKLVSIPLGVTIINVFENPKEK